MFVIMDRVLVTIILVVLIAGIGLALLKGRDLTKKVRNALVLGLIVSFVACAFSVKRLYDANKVIGTYGGVELDRIVIDGVVYEADYDNPYSSSDKKKLLGKVVFNNPSGNGDYDPMYVWSIDDDNEFIYALSVYDGMVFRVAA